jgi:hypothetical protein
MNTIRTVYFCPICFEVSESATHNHDHPMLQLDPAAWSEEQRKPPTDPAGQLMSRAPVWFMQLIGKSPVQATYAAAA